MRPETARKKALEKLAGIVRAHELALPGPLKNQLAKMANEEALRLGIVSRSQLRRLDVQLRDKKL